jgi:hypothetical protein
MKESDWKLFTQIKKQALDEFCLRCFAEFQKAMDDKSIDIHSRYLLNYKLVRSRDKKMSVFFDGHSRSNAWLQLLAIRGAGLADEVLISQLPDEFQKQTETQS